MSTYPNLVTLNKEKLLENALEMRGIIIQSQKENDLSNHIINIMNKMDFISTELLAVKDELKVIKNENKSLKKRIVELEDYADQSDDQFYQLEKRMNKLEQYTRRENIEISGISDELPQDKLEGTVMEVLKSINVNIVPNDIEACHKLQSYSKLRPSKFFYAYSSSENNVCTGGAESFIHNHALLE